MIGESEQARYERFLKEVEETLDKWPRKIPIPDEFVRTIERALKERREYKLELDKLREEVDEARIQKMQDEVLK